MSYVLREKKREHVEDDTSNVCVLSLLKTSVNQHDYYTQLVAREHQQHNKIKKLTCIIISTVVVCIDKML